MEQGKTRTSCGRVGAAARRLMIVLGIAALAQGGLAAPKPSMWVSPHGEQPGTYWEWQASHRPVPTSYAKRGYAPAAASRTRMLSQALAVPSPGTPLFDVFVNATLYTSVAASVGQYVSDLLGEGYRVNLYTGTWASPQALRAQLQADRGYGLVGCLFIGNLPIVWYELTEPASWGGAAVCFPCDLYYEDLDGTWSDGDGDGAYDGHTGAVAPDIWVGRLAAQTLTWEGEAALVNNYFAKNHAYRAGTLFCMNQALLYVDDDWASYTSQYAGDVALAYPARTVVYDGNTTVAPDYEGRLPQSYEWVSIHAHSWSGGHVFKTADGTFNGGYTYNSEIRDIDPDSLFYNLFACSAARYTDANYIGGWYVFTRNLGLAAIGSTKTGGMLNYQTLYQPLGAGATLGEAFRQWQTVNNESGMGTDSRAWFYGLTILGDPTLGIHVPHMLAGWPQALVGEARSSPALVDLDGDGDLEVVVLSADGTLNAWHADGSVVAGWPQSIGGAESAPVAGDLDGDGAPEVVTTAIDGRVYVWHGQGMLASGWPRSAGGSRIFASPALGDIDGDGDPEVVVATENGTVYAWHASGALVAGWPRAAAAPIYDAPALADLDGNGALEVIVASGLALYAWTGSGVMVAGWPVNAGGIVQGSPAIGDLNGDGWPEVAVATAQGVCAFHVNGSLLSGWPRSFPLEGYSPVLGDLDNDGALEVVVTSNDGLVYAWNGDGSAVAGWPQSAGSPLVDSPALGDLNGDGLLEVIAPAADGRMCAWTGAGTPLSHWSYVGSLGPGGSPTLADLDGDGVVDVVWVSDGAVQAWSTDVPSSDALAWPMLQHDAAHTGRYGGAVPSAPSRLSASASSATEVNLGWVDNATNESGFAVERKTGPEGAWEQVACVGSNVTSYRDGSVSANTAYVYRVRAFNGAGVSGYSNEASATTPAAPALVAPGSLAARANSASTIIVTWKDTNTSELGVCLERKIGASGTWSRICVLPANATSYQDSGLTRSTTYYYRAYAYNATSTSPYSNISGATTKRK